MPGAGSWGRAEVKKMRVVRARNLYRLSIVDLRGRMILGLFEKKIGFAKL